jgi:tRNA (guanine-N7-)-methyltransferase
MRMRNKPWAKPVLEQCPYYYDDPFRPMGDWQNCFPNVQPMHLELGCGKGSFLAHLAADHPEINYLAIDMKSIVLASAVKNIEQVYTERGIEKRNIVLTAYDIERILNIMTERDVVERIYINFCNPWPKPRYHKKRLTHTRQLLRYQTFLADGGELHFKTDDDGLFEDTLGYLAEAGFEVVYLTRDLHHSDYGGNIDTEHEKKFCEQGIPIKFLIAVYHKKPE